VYRMKLYMKHARVYIQILLIVSGISVAACAQQVELIDPPLLYEITGHPRSGLFGRIVSMAIDKANQSLYVLHDEPPLVSSFFLNDGHPLEQVEIKDKVDDARGAVSCGGRLWLLHAGGLSEITAGGRLAEPGFKVGKDGQLSGDILECYGGDMLVVADRTRLEISLVPLKEGKASVISGVEIVGPGRPAKRIFSSIDDIAFDARGTIYVLDSKRGVVVRIDTAGKVLETIYCASPMDTILPPKPVSIAVDTELNLWTINDTENTLDVFTTFGNMAYRMESMGDSGFNFIDPGMIVCDDRDKLFLADGGVEVIKVYEAGGLW